MSISKKYKDEIVDKFYNENMVKFLEDKDEIFISIFNEPLTVNCYFGEALQDCDKLNTKNNIINSIECDVFDSMIGLDLKTKMCMNSKLFSLVKSNDAVDSVSKFIEAECEVFEEDIVLNFNKDDIILPNGEKKSIRYVTGKLNKNSKNINILDIYNIGLSYIAKSSEVTIDGVIYSDQKFSTNKNLVLATYDLKHNDNNIRVYKDKDVMNFYIKNGLQCGNFMIKVLLEVNDATYEIINNDSKIMYNTFWETLKDTYDIILRRSDNKFPISKTNIIVEKIPNTNYEALFALIDPVKMEVYFNPYNITIPEIEVDKTSVGNAINIDDTNTVYTVTGSFLLNVKLNKIANLEYNTKNKISIGLDKHNEYSCSNCLTPRKCIACKKDKICCYNIDNETSRKLQYGLDECICLDCSDDINYYLEPSNFKIVLINNKWELTSNG